MEMCIGVFVDVYKCYKSKFGLLRAFAKRLLLLLGLGVPITLVFVNGGYESDSDLDPY